MPQFDIFFFFNNVFFFSTMFLVLYITTTWFFLPKILKIMLLRKQKLEYLTRMQWIYSNRLQQWSVSKNAISVLTFQSVFNFIKKNIFFFKIKTN